MAFWGTEVKPGKPYTHSFDRVRGRLHISQATLAIGTSAKKSLVQCNVGDKSPVLLCALLPDKTESLQLDLEFEETDDVIFSVIGPRGVHLTGYYVGGCRNSNFQDDTESYGEDINSDTEGSNRCADEEEDEYDDSFINDGEPEALTPSPVSSDGVVNELYIQKRRDGKGGRNRLKKRYQLVESDDETCSQQNIVNGSISIQESDDDDKFPVSSVGKSKTVTANMKPEVAEEKSNEVTVFTLEAGNKTKEGNGINPKTETDGSHVIDLKENFDVQFTNDDEPKRKGDPLCTSLLPTSEEVPEIRTKSKKKRKELSKEGKNIEDTLKVGKPHPNEVIAQKSGEYLLVDDKPDLVVATDKTSAVPCNSSARLFEAGLDNGKRLKKKRKGHFKKGEIHEDDGGRYVDSIKEDDGQQAEAEPDNIDQDVLLRNKDDRTTIEMTIDHSHESMLPSVDMDHERSSKVKKKRKEQTEVKADFSGSDLLIRTEQDQKSTTDKNFNIVSDQLGDGQSGDKKPNKKRRKKSKTEGNEENGNMEVKEENNRSAMESEKNVEARSSEVRTLSNGLIIEELGVRNSKGKKAALGKKVKVQYIVKLKESGHVIDSNIGKSPYKFRLGDNEVIEGLNVGLEGMRVGDKRRLIIPPSLSSGSEGAGENIPPNSWLVYDVDLVGVH